MKFDLKRTAATSLLALTLGAMLSGCATPAPNESTVASASSSTANVDAGMNEKSASGANKTMQAFLKQVEQDAYTWGDKVAAGADSKDDVVFFESFKPSSDYITPGAFTDKELRNMLVRFAIPYLNNTDLVQIQTDAAAFEMSGDSATIRGNRFNVYDDKKPVRDTSASDGDVTLDYVDGEWFIAVYAPAK